MQNEEGSNNKLIDSSSLQEKTIDNKEEDKKSNFREFRFFLVCSIYFHTLLFLGLLWSIGNKIQVLDQATIFCSLAVPWGYLLIIFWLAIMILWAIFACFFS